MTVPNRTITIKDGGNGVSPGTSRTRALIGAASSGSYNTVTACTAPNQVSDAFGLGPLIDCGKYELQNGGGTLLCIRGVSSVTGTVTTAPPYITGDATCTCAGTPNNKYQITVQITVAGTLGTAVFKYSLDDGPDSDEYNWSLPVSVPGGGTYAIPNTGLTLTFADPVAVLHFKVGDTYRFSSTAPSMASADVQAALDALIAYTGYYEWVHVAGEVTAAIAGAVSTKMTSLETAHKYRFAIVEAADVSAIGSVTKAGTAPPDITVTGIPTGSWDVHIKTTLIGALGTSKIQYSLDGGNSWSADITTTAVTGITNIGQYGLILTVGGAIGNVDNTWEFQTWDETETAWVTALQSAYASTTSNRVLCGAGFGELSLPSGQVVRRPIAWALAAILAKIDYSTDPGQVLDAGTLPGCSYISHDEAAVPGLDDLRFCTSRSWDKFAGYYINQGRMMAAAGSDYDLVQYRRVMDQACEALDSAMVLWVNKKVRVDATTGYIDERDARSIERKLLQAVKDAVVIPGHASEATVYLHRNENILSTRTLNVDLQVIGLAYCKTLAATIGYLNPVLVVPTT